MVHQVSLILFYVFVCSLFSLVHHSPGLFSLAVPYLYPLTQVPLT